MATARTWLSAHPRSIGVLVPQPPARGLAAGVGEPSCATARPLLADWDRLTWRTKLELAPAQREAPSGDALGAAADSDGRTK